MTMDDLDEIADTAIDLVKFICKQKFGIPDISKSILSTREREYLNIAQKLGVSVTSAEERAVLHDAIFKGSTLRDLKLFPLIEQRDELSNTIQSQRNKIKRMVAEYMELDAQNRALHEINAKYTQDICSKMNNLKIEQRSKFSAEQLENYNRAVESVNETKQKVAVLREFNIALIGAAGIDWLEDERLSHLVLNNNNDSDDDDNDLMM